MKTASLLGFVALLLVACSSEQFIYSPKVIDGNFSVLGQFEQESDESLGLYYIIRDGKGQPYLLRNCTQRTKPILDNIYTAQGMLIEEEYCYCSFSKAGSYKIRRDSCVKSGKERCMNDTLELRKTVLCTRQLARMQTE